MERQRFTAEFKREAVRLMERGDKPLAQLALQKMGRRELTALNSLRPILSLLSLLLVLFNAVPVVAMDGWMQARGWPTPGGDPVGPAGLHARLKKGVRFTYPKAGSGSLISNRQVGGINSIVMAFENCIRY